MKLYSALFQQHDPFGIFDGTITVSSPKQLKEDGTLILWGGEDISPSVYKQLPVHTHANKTPSKRDLAEIALAKRAMELGMPIIGVCRGAQLMCCLSGGTLFQHIEGHHHQTHLIKTYQGTSMRTSSCHHQALNINGTNGEILAYDEIPVTVFTDTDHEYTTIPEVVYFKETRTFAIQGHPEWMHEESEFVSWCSSELQLRGFA